MVALVSSFLVVGCDSGPKYYPVSGTVVFKQDGSTAQFGSIEFRSESEPPVVARGEITKAGTFSLASSGKIGTIGGSHTVVIIQVIGNPRGNVRHNHGLEVAKKYSDHRTTDLKVNVTKENASTLVLEVDSNNQ